MATNTGTCPVPLARNNHLATMAIYGSHCVETLQAQRSSCHTPQARFYLALSRLKDASHPEDVERLESRLREVLPASCLFILCCYVCL